MKRCLGCEATKNIIINYPDCFKYCPLCGDSLSTLKRKRGKDKNEQTRNNRNNRTL
jgi:rRNA maturation endonuclease Nob1